MARSTKILAIDQGTTSTKAVVFDDEARPLGSARLELSQHFPQSGWVEHDPLEIAETAVAVSRLAVERAGLRMADITALGITNQRETTVVWDRQTGRPIANAIVWQCRRTMDICRSLELGGYSAAVRQTTGLVIDPYFSGAKLKWLLDGVPGARDLAADGRLCFGTVDSWLIYRLTGGAEHVTDVTNASRTMLLNLHDLTWDPDMLEMLDIPDAVLPSVRPSASDFGVTDGGVIGAEIPITGVAGDQHAALYGHACFEPGMTKCTYGTGAFVLSNTGTRPVISADGGLLATVGWQVGAKRVYALEGSVFVTGATVQWLRDGLGVIGDAAETEEMAVTVGENGGVYFVPAFVGLGSPYWDPAARASITGISRGTNRRHIVRAGLEATAYQVKDIVDAMDSVAGRRQTDRPLRVDGGQTVNRFLMQFQADMLDRPVEVSAVEETTALGAAFLAGRGAGVWRSEADIARLWRSSATFEPQMGGGERRRLYAGWRDAVRRTLSAGEA